MLFRQTETPAPMSVRALCLSYGFGVLRGGDAEFLLELSGEMVHRGILQCSGNFREVQIVFPDHLLALLKLDAADILAGGDLQMLLEHLVH